MLVIRMLNIGGGVVFSRAWNELLTVPSSWHADNIKGNESISSFFSSCFSIFLFFIIQIAEREGGLLLAALTTHLNVQHYYDQHPLAPFFPLNAFNTAKGLDWFLLRLIIDGAEYVTTWMIQFSAKTFIDPDRLFVRGLFIGRTNNKNHRKPTPNEYRILSFFFLNTENDWGRGERLKQCSA